MQKRYEHEIIVERPVEEAFPLFTPLGEEAWVPGWNPIYIRPESGETCEEMIFTTGEDEEKTYWTCLKWRPDDWHVRYLRLTPASRVSFVEVDCAPEGDDKTRVHVVYDTQALSSAGEAYLADLSEQAFAASIDEWSHLIKKMS